MLKRLGKGIFLARRNVLVVGLSIVMIAAVFGAGVLGALKSGGFYDPNSESMKAENLLNEKLGGASADVIILMQGQKLKVTDRTFAMAVQGLVARLKTRSEVRSILSYYSTRSQSLLSKDGHETLVLLQLTATDETRKEQDYHNIQALIKAPPLRVLVAGTVPVNIAFNQLVDTDLHNAEMVTFPIVTLLLLFVFGGLIAAMVPLAIGGIAIISTFAILKLVTYFTDVSIFAINIVTMLGLGLAIDYALFIVTGFREELSRDELDIQGALERTMATAGRTVLFSGLTVSTSLVSLLLFPEVFLHSMGIGAIATILVVMITTLTLLPASLAILGKHINALSFGGILLERIKKRVKLQQKRGADKRGAWYRLSEFVMCWPIPVALVVLVILITLGIPFLHIRFATPDEHSLPAGQEARIVSQHLAQDFVTDGNSLIMIAITTPGNALSAKNLANLSNYVRSIKAIPGVVNIESLVTVNPSLSLAQYQRLYAYPQASPYLASIADQMAKGDYTRVIVQMQPVEHSEATQDIIRKVRAIAVPEGFVPLVDGVTASQMDLLMNIGAILPYALIILVVVVFVLLFLMTGSLLIPLKALLLNLLSLTATFGGLVWIFQDGHLQNIFNFPSLGSIDATQPMLIFAIAFGLSMDYEVFLLSRIKEYYVIMHDNRAAVASGLQRTGWLITSAALLLVVVLGAFGFAKVIIVQEVGIGLTIAIIMDATLVRTLLVPATMRLLGNWNWWAPKPLKVFWEWVGLSECTKVVETLPALAEKVMGKLPEPAKRIVEELPGPEEKVVKELPGPEEKVVKKLPGSEGKVIEELTEPEGNIKYAIANKKLKKDLKVNILQLEQNILQLEQEMIAKNEQAKVLERIPRGDRQAAQYLLQGLIVCNRCGNACYGKAISQSSSKGKSHSYAYYCCIGTDVYHLNGARVCENKQLRTDLVDKVVWNEVCQLLKHPERFEQEYHRLITKIVIRELYKIKEQIDKLKQGRMRLIDSYTEGLIDKAEFEPRITRMREQIKQLEEQYQNIKKEACLEKELRQLLEGLDDIFSSLREGLEAADWSTRREIIQALVKRVEINQEQVRVVFRVGSSASSSSSGKDFPEFVAG